MSLLSNIIKLANDALIDQYSSNGQTFFETLRTITRTLLENKNPALYKDIINTINISKEAFSKYCYELKIKKDVNILNAAHKSVLDITQYFRNPKIYEVSDEYKRALYAGIQQSYKPYIDSYNALSKEIK